MISTVLKEVVKAILWGLTYMTTATAIFVHSSVLLAVTTFLTGVCMVATISLLSGELPLDRPTNGR
jgi:hypothetical protein